MRKAVLAFSFAIAASLAFAQSDRGTITGTVSDPAGAVVPNAPIEARNTATGGLYATATSESGNYTIPQLPPGQYELTVAVPGFKNYTRSGLTVQVASVIRIDVPLEVGSSTESVTVTADATLLRTESGELSHNVRAADMNSLPILGIGGTQSGSAGIRNPYAMIQLIPGTAWIPNSNVRVNGAPSNSQAFRIEGQDATNTGTPGVPQQNQPSVDAIQEVAIQSSNYSAEFGQVGGGLFNVTMKSGTNQYHGTAYDYFVNEVFNAGQPFTNNPDGNPRPRARRQDYGFTIGGPVSIPKVYNGRDKTFFFFNWEEFREKTVVNSQFQTVPTLGYRAGDFRQAVTTRPVGTDPLGNAMREGMIYDPQNNITAPDGRLYRLQFPNNTIPVIRFDPIASKIQNLIPLPKGPTPLGLTNNYQEAYDTSRTTRVPSIKLDQSIGSNGKLAFFYQKTETENPNGNTIFGQADGLPDPLTTALGTFQNAPLYRLNYDHTVTPTILLHLGAGYRSNYFWVPAVTRNGEITNYNAEAELGLKGGIVNQWFPPMSGMLPTTGQGGMKNIGQAADTTNITQSPTFNATVSWVKDNHTFKFGSEFRTEGYPVRVGGNLTGSYVFSAAQTGQPFQNVPAAGGANVGFGYASFLLGQVQQVSISNPTNPRLGKKQFGVYAQDTWKVTRKLTFDYGVRYDYSTYLQEQYGRAPVFSPTALHPLGVLGASVYDRTGPGRCNCNIANNYPFAFAPRLGAAYQINTKTVFRLGFGIVYNGTEAHNNAGGGLGGSSATTPSATFGLPITTLSAGIPVSFRPPAWPDFNPGRSPAAAPTPGPFGPGALMDHNAGRPARQYQWSIGIQREIASDLVVETSYVANRGVWWQAPGLLNLNAIQLSTLNKVGLDINQAADRTLLTSFLSSQAAAARGFNGRPYGGFPLAQTVGQALRPFPQFTDIPVYWSPLGKSWYDSLQVKATKRLSNGLSFLSTFTWQRSLTQGSEIGEPNPGTTGGAVFNDVFNRGLNKYISQYDQPFVFNISAQYMTPGVGTNRVLSWVVRDWSLGAFLQYASGQPIIVPSAQAVGSQATGQAAIGSYLFQNSFANRVPGQPLFTVPDMNCHCYDPNTTFVLNPNAWTEPAPGQFGTSAAYYSDYRRQRRPIENLNVGRTFRIREGVTFNIRAEFSNVFNRAFWGEPTNNNARLNQTRLPNGNTNAGFGKLNTTTQLSTANLLPRSGLIVGRISF